MITILLYVKFSISSIGVVVGKNGICGRNMYAIHGGGRTNKIMNIYYTNANGLKHNGKVPKITEAAEEFKEKNIDVVLLAETGLNCDKRIELKLKRQLKEVQGGVILVTLNVDDGKLGYLQGGALTVELGGITGCVDKLKKDVQGRWSMMKFKGRHGANLY